MARLSKQNEELLKAVQKQVVREQGGANEEHTRRAHLSHDSRSASAVGLGVDLLEIERMERAIKRTPRILERVFTSGEREYAWSKAKPAVHYAAFFAAREAVLKALGCGFSGVNYSDVEIIHDSKGKPEVQLHGNASAIAEQQGIIEIQISLSHTHQMAVASAVAIKAQSSPPKKEVLDPMEELARQFKELRLMLDDLGVSSILSKETGNKTEEGSDKESLEQTEEGSSEKTAEEAVSVSTNDTHEADQLIETELETDEATRAEQVEEARGIELDEKQQAEQERA